MTTWPLLLAQDDNAGAAGAAVGGLFALVCNCVIPLAIYALIAAGLWKLFEKAGKPGWAGIVPIYNMFVVTELSGKEIVWFILLFVPCINIVAAVLIWMDFAKAYGKDALWGLGLAFLGPIFVPLLGFSDAKYVGPPPKTM